MKGLRVFAMIALVFALLIGLPMLLQDRSYDWEPTFGNDDDDPFGCELFDKMVGRSMGERYTAESKSASLRKLKEQEYEEPQGWLFVNYQLQLTAAETADLLSLTRRGDCVLLNSTSFGQPLCDSLNIEMAARRAIPDADELEDAMSTFNLPKQIVWAEEHRHDEYHFNEIMVMRQFLVHSDSLHVKELAYCYDDDTEQKRKKPQKLVAASIAVGKGEIIVVTTPLLFTNYGMLNGRGSQYIFRLLSCFGDKPVHRVVLKTHKSEREEDWLAMLDFIEEQPPLHWAWNLMLVLVILFILTNARRKQRIIPVVTAPQNHSTEFVRLIGTLYYHQGSHADLVAKKFHYTAEQLRRDLHVDIADPQEDHMSAAIIAQNTGINADEVARTIKEVREKIGAHLAMNKQQMRDYIDQLDRLTQS